MVIYWSILLWVFFVGLCQPNKNNPLLSNNAVGAQATWKLAIALMLPVTFFAAVRGAIMDTGVYIATFRLLPQRLDVFNEWILTQQDSSLFYGLSAIWKSVVSNDSVWWLTLIATVQGVLLAVTFRRYSPNMPMSVYIFIASTTFTWMFNGMRQFLVITVLFALTECIIKNRWYIYVPAVLILAGMEPILTALGLETPWWLDGMHQSALLMIPVFFFVQGKAWNWKMLLMTAVFCVLALTGSLAPLLESTAEGTEYESDVVYFEEEGDDGASPIRAVVAAVPVVMALVKKKEIDAMGEQVPPIVPISINMSIFTVALYLASTLTSSGILVGRLPMYTELYGYILIPWLIQNPYKKDQQMLTYGVYGAYLMWFVYQMYIGFGAPPYVSDVLGLRIL